MLIAGPNLTTDRTLELEELRPGEVLRFTSAKVTPGGKGVNVARVARVLGAPALLVSLAPGRTGHAVVELVRDEGLAVRSVPVRGEVRAAIVVLEASGRVTVMNEPGPSVDAAGWGAYEQAIEESLEGQRLLVCSGSVPPGAPPDAYAGLVRIARSRSVPALVDAAGTALREALSARPDYVTPNLAEAEGALFGPRPEADLPADEARGRALAAAARLADLGVALPIVTAGAAGLAFSLDGQGAWIDAPAVSVRNPVGAGDSFVGGFAAALERSEPAAAAVVAGIATAAASVETQLAGGIDPARARALAEAIATG